MDKGNVLKQAIDEHIEESQDDGFRAHLGASVIGRMCEREIWYSWRWALKKKHDARLLRLFDRGHKEEFRFEEWLKPVCSKFWPVDPRTGEQIRISDFKGYFGGSLDGIIRDPFGQEGDFLTEFKTHNEKSFVKLSLDGVAKAKPEHYVQMQIYLKYHPKLKGAYYFAVCKNDDHLYVEYIERDEDCAIAALEKVKRILSSPVPSERHSAASEYHYYCKYFCDYKELCFGKTVPHVSCRSCGLIKPTDEGFTCAKTNNVLSVDEQKAACGKYERNF